MDIPKKGTIKYTILRLGLMLGALGWGVSFGFSVLPWEICMNILEYFGFPTFNYSPILNYGLKMSCVIFGCIGVLHLSCFLNPVSNLRLICEIGIFSIILGLISLVLISVNNLFASYGIIVFGDALFCFVIGASILFSLEKKYESP